MKLLIVLLSGLRFLIAKPVLHAQSTTGQLTGTVNDSIEVFVKGMTGRRVDVGRTQPEPCLPFTAGAHRHTNILRQECLRHQKNPRPPRPDFCHELLAAKT